MAKMPDHINVTLNYVPPQTTTAVPCNHVFPYWSVIPPTHCPCCGPVLSLHRRRLRARTTHRPTVVARAERARYPRYDDHRRARTRARGLTQATNEGHQCPTTQNPAQRSASRSTSSAITAWDKVKGARRHRRGHADHARHHRHRIPQTANGIIAFAGALLLALGVKPLGPATE